MDNQKKEDEMKKKDDRTNEKEVKVMIDSVSVINFATNNNATVIRVLIRQ